MASVVASYKGNHLHAVPNVLAVGEGDEAGVDRGHRAILERRKGEKKIYDLDLSLAPRMTALNPLPA
jgi:hypothetical protein